MTRLYSAGILRVILPGDFDSDGDVDGADFVAWQTHFPLASGATLGMGDNDGDGDVDGADFVAWQTHYPYTPGIGVATVSEPQSLAAAFAGLLALLGARVATVRRWFVLWIRTTANRIALVAMLTIGGEGLARAQFDWTGGDWNIKVVSSGIPGALPTGISFPGGSKSGIDLQVYHQSSPIDFPQLASISTKGYSRFVAKGGRWGPSLGSFTYFGDTDVHNDAPVADGFQVVGVTPDGGLRLLLNYKNNDLAANNQFDIHSEMEFHVPTPDRTAVTITTTVTNRGDAVVPFWEGHRDLAEQWVLGRVSTMNFLDDFSSGIPNWYNLLDPQRRYVGNIVDSNPLNDGFSETGQVYVPTHDTERFVFDDTEVQLDHEMPHTVVPGLEWYDQLVLLDESSRRVSLETLYEPKVNHHIELLSASGLINNVSHLKYAITYNRNDINLFDGDNTILKLGMDDLINIWPSGASQTFTFRLTVGARPLVSGDFDGDGDVDGADFVAWQTNFPKESGATLAQGDADGDGDVDGADFVVWQTNFPFTPGAAASSVPEPAAWLLSLSAVALLAKFRAARARI
jgi:hypothetical protein